MSEKYIVFGPAGTGKTTLGMSIVHSFLHEERGSKADIAYVSFTRAAAQEAIRRAGIDRSEYRELWFRTLHSMCFKLLGLKRENTLQRADMREFSREMGVQIDDPKGGSPEWDVADYLLDVTYENRGNQRSIATEILQAYKKGRLLCTTVQELDEVRRAPHPLVLEELGFQGLSTYATFVQEYEGFKARKSLIDYTDMLERVLRERPWRPPWKLAIVDECQDASPLLHRVQRDLLYDADKVVLLGDDDQCQPPGTMVLTREGEKRIEEVRAGEEVASWGRSSQHVSYLRKGRRVLEVAHRRYRGPLLRIHAGSKETRCTPDHRFFVKWRRDCSLLCTYLMRRGDRFRVGWCQIFNSEGVFHLAVRARAEGADEAWILNVHFDRAKASTDESVIAATYGIPTATFKEVQGAYYLKQGSLDEIFSRVPEQGERARRCLVDHGRATQYPLYAAAAPSTRRGRTTVCLVRACNLIPEFMLVPVPRGEERMKADWSPIDWVSLEPYEGVVFSLRVEKDETYVADGIVTHNSLYSFSGASACEFLAYRGEFKPVILQQTHRFGPEIVKMAAQITDRIQERQEKDVIPKQNAMTRIYVDSELNPKLPGSKFILHRHVMGCRRIAKRLMDLGLPFRNERGLDPLRRTSEIRAFRAFKELPERPISHQALLELIDHIPSRGAINGEPVRLIKHGAKKQLREQYVDSWTLEKLDRVFSDVLLDRIRRQDFSVTAMELAPYYQLLQEGGFDLLKDRPDITITTVHGSKGRDRDHVYLCSEIYPSLLGQDDENRVAYVGVTRAKETLTVVRESFVGDWTTEYEYPLEDAIDADEAGGDYLW